MISAKTFDADKIKIDENSQKNTFICHIGYMTFKDPSYSKINSVHPLHLILIKQIHELQKAMQINISGWFLLMKAKTYRKI